MSKLLDIITNPNPILRKKSLEINPSDIGNPDFQDLIDIMTKTMIKKDGVGLAAPQVAKNIRLIVIHFNNKDYCIINPVISKKSWAKEAGEEGCLSVPNVFGVVSRHKKLIINYLDRHGNKNKLKTEGFLARIIQHELDHLDGILFIDKAKNIRKD